MLEGAYQVPREVVSRGVHARWCVDTLARHRDALEDGGRLPARGDVVQHGEHVHVLAEDAAIRVVGEQASRRFPALRADRITGLVGARAIPCGLAGVAERCLELRAL